MEALGKLLKPENAIILIVPHDLCVALEIENNQILDIRIYNFSKFNFHPKKIAEDFCLLFFLFIPCIIHVI